MKKIQILSLAICVALTYACNFTEEIHLKEDGSGKLSINFDGSELMQMAGEEVAKTNEKAVDSIISFKKLLEEKKDSIAQLSPKEQAIAKSLEPFSLRMVMNPEKKVMSFDLFGDFNDISEMNNAFNTFQEASMMGSNKAQQPAPVPASDQSTEVNYTFTKDKFTRSARIVNKELFQQRIDSLQGAEMFLSGSTYTLKYHFPKRVKSTTAEEATFTADGKTMIYEVSFLELMKNPSLLDLEVELED